jgi:DNA-binding FrmR family transcriptional regulator
MHEGARTGCLDRPRRIEGQVRGPQRMIEEGRNRVDTLTRGQAVRAALRRVEDEVLKDHEAHCGEHAIAGGAAAGRRKVGALRRVLGRRGG